MKIYDTVPGTMTTALIKHCEQHRALVNRLRRSGRRDVRVLSILLVESYFRSGWYRALEIVAWALLSIVRVRRVATLSVGPGQIQLRHWKASCSWVSLTADFARVRLVINWDANFDVADTLLRGATTCRRRAAVYRGEARSHYVTCLEDVQSWLTTSAV